MLRHALELLRQGGADEFGLGYLPGLCSLADGVAETSGRAGANYLDVSGGVGVGYLSVLVHDRSVLQTALTCYQEAVNIVESAEYASKEYSPLQE